MKSLILLLLTLVLITGCYNPSSKESFHDLGVIVGKWHSYKGVGYNQSWFFNGNNNLKGVSFSMNGIDTAFMQTTTVEMLNDSVYYRVLNSVSANSTNTTNFVLSEASKSNWVFINYFNTYPAIITYNLLNDSMLTVTTSNIRGNKRQYFYLKRMN